MYSSSNDFSLRSFFRLPRVSSIYHPCLQSRLPSIYHYHRTRLPHIHNAQSPNTVSLHTFSTPSCLIYMCSCRSVFRAIHHYVPHSSSQWRKTCFVHHIQHSALYTPWVSCLSGHQSRNFVPHELPQACLPHATRILVSQSRQGSDEARM